MINSLDTYRRVGEQIATAGRRHDAALAYSLTQWYRSAKFLEGIEHKMEIEAAYAEGYRLGSGIYAVNWAY